MKKKALLALLCLGPLIFSSCALTQKALTFDIATIKKGQSYPVLSYADDKRAHFVSGDEVYESFLNNTYDALIFDLNKGLDLIRNQKSNYKLVRVTNYGNAYIVKRNSYNKDHITGFSDVVSFENGLSHYDLDDRVFLDTGVHNNLYRYCTGLDLNTIDHIYPSVGDAYNAFINGQGDFAILEEPYVSKLITRTEKDYSLYMNLVDEFALLDGEYTKVPNTGLFISPRLENLTKGNDKKILDNFLESVDKNLRDLETGNGMRNMDFVKDYINKGTVDIYDYFGCTSDELGRFLNGETNPNGINAFGFCSHPIDLDGFIKNQNAKNSRIFVPEIPSYCYSKHFNFIDKK